MTALTLRDRRVVVLGATGFIGRWVARSASAAGARVWLVARNAAAAEKIAADYSISGTIAEIDVTKPEDLQALMRDVQPAVTFNLAGYGVDRRETDEEMAAAINSELVARLIELVSIHVDHSWPGLRLLHAGSALEYGAVGGRLAEDAGATPTTVYGRTKLAATRMIEASVAEGKTRAATARLFTVYGPGEHDGRLLPSILAARGGSAPVQMTDGYQRRDFTYVGDVAEGFIRAVTSGPPDRPTVNLATGRLHTVREFVAFAESALEIPRGCFEFGALPTRPDEMAHAEVTVDRARRWLGWVPDTEIAEGVRVTAQFLADIAGRTKSLAS